VRGVEDSQHSVRVCVVAGRRCVIVAGRRREVGFDYPAEAERPAPRWRDYYLHELATLKCLVRGLFAKPGGKLTLHNRRSRPRKRPRGGVE
jgi:hypothetical protein